MIYIDLFAGMGGFHQAAIRLTNANRGNWRCLMACELNKEARQLYSQTYNIDERNFQEDVTLLQPDNIGQFHVLFAGFPCQPFSKAGNRTGFEHDLGNMFNHIMNILEQNMPRFIVLENVQNLASHDEGNTYRVIRERLLELGYRIPEVPSVISPDDIGIPQLRKRVYIAAELNGPEFDLNSIKENDIDLIPLNNFLNQEIVGDQLSEEREIALEFWIEFITRTNGDIPSPLWFNYIDADTHEWPVWKSNLFGKTLNWLGDDGNSLILDEVRQEHNFDEQIDSYKKLEWNMQRQNWNVNSILQFRPSGLRFKNNDKMPTLVAMNQRPYLVWLNRYVTVNELLELHGFHDINREGINDSAVLRMLGNTVSVDVVERILDLVYERTIDDEQ